MAKRDTFYFDRFVQSTAKRELTVDLTDVTKTVSRRKIYECFEVCSDACEHAAWCIDSVIIKNTGYEHQPIRMMGWCFLQKNRQTT